MTTLARRDSGDRLFAIVLFTATAAVAAGLVVKSLPAKSASAQLLERLVLQDNAPGRSAPAASVIPASYPPVRYQQMSAKSPFALATAAAPVAAATPGFAENLYVAGVARIGIVNYVSIKSRADDKTMLFLQVGGTPSPDGIKVDRLDWSEEMGKSKVHVTKGVEQATLSFDQDQMAKATTAAPPPPPQMNRGPVLPGGQPMLPNGMNQGPGIFQRQRMINPGAPALPGGGGGGGPQFHRRAVIPSGQ